MASGKSLNLSELQVPLLDKNTPSVPSRVYIDLGRGDRGGHRNPDHSDKANLNPELLWPMC